MKYESYGDLKISKLKNLELWFLSIFKNKKISKGKKWGIQHA